MRYGLMQKGEMQVDSERELQDDRDNDGQHQQHHCYTQPAEAVAGFDALTVSLHILGELGPVLFALGAREGLEALQPLFFVKAEEAAVTAHDATIEDAAGQLGVVAFFERAQITRGHLGGLGDRLQRHIALDALLLQLRSKGHEKLRQPAIRAGCAHNRVSVPGSRSVPPQYNPKDAGSTHDSQNATPKGICVHGNVFGPTRHALLDSRSGSCYRVNWPHMRLAFPDRIPLGKAVACAAGFAVIQLFERTAPSFVVLFFAFVVLSVMAFNYAGGFSRPSGVYIFWFALLAVIFGVFMKAAFREPGQTNLHTPQTTMTVYICSVLMMWLAAAVSRKFTWNSPGLALVLGANRINLGYSAAGCVALGVLLIIANNFIPQSPGGFLAALNQINYFLPLGIILGTVDALQKSHGRRSTNYLVLMAMLFGFGWGLVQFSKQGMFTPFVAWLLAAFHMRMRLRPVHYLSMIGFAVLSFTVLSPLSVGRDDVYPGMTIGAKLQLAGVLILNVNQVRQDLYDDRVHAEENGWEAVYYNQPEGLIDRLSMVPNDDSLIDFTTQGHVLGYKVIEGNFQNWIPHFLMPNKMQLNEVGGGNFYEHEMGNLPVNDITTGISFSPAAEAFHLGGWEGIFLVMPLIFTMFFCVFDLLLGDMRRHAWGILVILLFGHLAPEAGIVGPIYETMFGSIAVVGSIVFCIYVAPILGAALSPHTQLSSDPAAV